MSLFWWMHNIHCTTAPHFRQSLVRRVSRPHLSYPWAADTEAASFETFFLPRTPPPESAPAIHGRKVEVKPRRGLASMLILGLVETGPGPGCDSFLAAVPRPRPHSRLGSAPTVSTCFSTDLRPGPLAASSAMATPLLALAAGLLLSWYLLLLDFNDTRVTAAWAWVCWWTLKWRHRH